MSVSGGGVAKSWEMSLEVWKMGVISPGAAHLCDWGGFDGKRRSGDEEDKELRGWNGLGLSSLCSM